MSNVSLNLKQHGINFLKQNFVFLLVLAIFLLIGFTVGVGLNVELEQGDIPAKWTDTTSTIATLIAAVATAGTAYLAYMTISNQLNKDEEAKKPFLLVSGFVRTEINYKEKKLMSEFKDGGQDGAVYPLKFSLTNMSQKPIYVRGAVHFSGNSNSRSLPAASNERMEYLESITGFTNASGRVFQIGPFDKNGLFDMELSVQSKEGLLIEPSATKSYTVLWYFIWSRFKITDELRIYFQYASTGSVYHYLPIILSNTEELEEAGRDISSLIFKLDGKNYTDASPPSRFQQQYRFNRS